MSPKNDAMEILHHLLSDIHKDEIPVPEMEVVEIPPSFSCVFHRGQQYHTTNSRVWYGTIQPMHDGTWIVDFQGALFSEPPTLQLSIEIPPHWIGFGQSPFAYITSCTTIQATGKVAVIMGTSPMILPPETKVHITALGPSFHNPI